MTQKQQQRRQRPRPKLRRQRIVYGVAQLMMVFVWVGLQLNVMRTCHAGTQWSFHRRAILPMTICGRHEQKKDNGGSDERDSISSKSLSLISRHGGSHHDSKHSSSSSSNAVSSHSSSSSSSSSSSPRPSINKVLSQWWSKIRTIWNDLTSGTVNQPGSQFLQHTLYWITAADTVHSMILNEYSNILLGIDSHPMDSTSKLVPSVYSRLFYFARLRPRLLYAIGALLRALQLCTPFRRVLDPTAGVGAGINLCALLAGSRWVKPLVLGWATTKWIWTWLGARQVDRAYLPITLSIHEWEEKKKHAKKAVKSDSSSD